tara:strand:+ start:124090 stop:124728 length:639 start_codon:yes stop_codon:yes gene_type:complete
MIIALLGFIGSGKGTVGECLVEEHGFVQESFAKPLKDAVSILYSWPRHLLEGDTTESREWREQPDSYWSSIMGREITPRSVLQSFGTDVMREHVHTDFWVKSMQKRIADLPEGTDVVITDCRFRNEIKAIRDMGGKVAHVNDGKKRDWFYIAHRAAQGNRQSIKEMAELGIHRSEWDWINTDPDIIINNVFEERNDRSLQLFKQEITRKIFN